VARRRRPSRSVLLRRWLAVGALVLVALLYYRPLRSWIQTRHTLDARRAEVHALQVERTSLERRLTLSTNAAQLAREARRLGYVRPGEKLFIVKGIAQWRQRLRTSIEGHGR
jgi:cell division protein FtsB